MAHLCVDAGVGHRELDEAVTACRDVEGRRVGGAEAAAKPGAGRARQFAQFRQRAFEFGGVRNAELDAARKRAYAAGNRDFLVAQHAADGIAQIIDHGLDDRLAVDLKQHMRAALQVKAEHDGADG